jgi:hypothetical protein
MLLYRTGGGGEQCGKVKLPHCSRNPLPSSLKGVESEGENERGPSQRGRSRGGGVGRGESVGAESEGWMRRGQTAPPGPEAQQLWALVTPYVTRGLLYIKQPMLL